MRTIPVVAAPVRTGTIDVYVNALGTVTPRNVVVVRPRVDGELLRVAFAEGQMVKAGDLLAEINPRPFQVQLAQATGQMARDTALLKNAQIDLAHYRTLLAQDSISRQQVDSQEALVGQYQGAVQTDQGQLDNAKLQLAYARVTAPTNAQIGVAEAAWFPSLTLGASGGFQSSVLADLLTLPSHYSALGPALIAQTLFDGGLRKAQSAQAVAAYDQTVAEYRQTVLTGFQEVKDNLAALRILAQEAALQEDAVRAAREAAAITLNRYKAGTTSFLAVVVLQNAALNTERTALGILGRRLVASVGLIKALGGGWDARQLAAAP